MYLLRALTLPLRIVDYSADSSASHPLNKKITVFSLLAWCPEFRPPFPCPPGRFVRFYNSAPQGLPLATLRRFCPLRASGMRGRAVLSVASARVAVALSVGVRCVCSLLFSALFFLSLVAVFCCPFRSAWFSFLPRLVSFFWLCGCFSFGCPFRCWRSLVFFRFFSWCSFLWLSSGCRRPRGFLAPCSCSFPPSCLCFRFSAPFLPGRSLARLFPFSAPAPAGVGRGRGNTLPFRN